MYVCMYISPCYPGLTTSDYNVACSVLLYSISMVLLMLCMLCYIPLFYSISLLCYSVLSCPVISDLLTLPLAQGRRHIYYLHDLYELHMNYY